METSNSGFPAVSNYFAWHSNTIEHKVYMALAPFPSLEKLVQGGGCYIQPFSGKAHCALGCFTSVGGGSTFFAALRVINTSVGSCTPAYACMKLPRERPERVLRMNGVAFVSPRYA